MLQVGKEAELESSSVLSGIPVCQKGIPRVVAHGNCLQQPNPAGGKNQSRWKPAPFSLTWFGCGLAWLSVRMLNPEQNTTWLSTPCWFLSKSSFLLCSTWAKPHQSHHSGSSPTFPSVLSCLFILAFLEALLYGRSSGEGSFCQSPYNQRSDIAMG